MLDEIKYQEKIDKLQKLSDNRQRLKLVYMWIKQNQISFSDFEGMLFYCN